MHIIVNFECDNSVHGLNGIFCHFGIEEFMPPGAISSTDMGPLPFFSKYIFAPSGRFKMGMINAVWYFP